MWAGGNYAGFGYSGGGYATSPFGSIGAPPALASRELQSEMGLAGQLGIYDRARDVGPGSRVFLDPSLNEDYAEFQPRGDGAYLVGSSIRGLGFGKVRPAMGHEYWHSVDRDPALLDELYELESLDPEPIRVFDSTFTNFSDRGLANVAQEFRATTYESRTSRHRGFNSDLSTGHYLREYGRPLEALGLEDRALALPPRLP